MAAPGPQPTNDLLFEDQVVRRAFKRLVIYFFILYLICYLDRVNIGFAALSMNRELRLTATMFGIATAMFNVGYALCEIPSNMLLTRYGARRWLTRIMVTWGLASTATMFASGAISLYTMRLILGIAEAGLFPGIVLYMTYWFPAAYRARATAIFMMGQPFAIAIGSSMSGLIMDHTHGVLGIGG